MRLRQLPVGATPRLQLAHRTAPGGPYDLHPITEPRPAVGTVDTTVTCGTCGEPVPLRLSSAEWVHWRRRSRLHTGVTILLASVLAGALLALQDRRNDWGGAATVGGLILIMLTVIGVGPYFSESRDEDGVTGFDPRHTLREPGDTHDHVTTDGSDYEPGP
ncbi:hypothetical protein [Actinoplanes sp. G11-F43]|uniref:hypothetical protein n=1 Tax=Actinoplanes sp. G11-F43 TaxID=3424130 RepID=UPI003D326CE7